MVADRGRAVTPSTTQATRHRQSRRAVEERWTVTVRSVVSRSSAAPAPEAPTPPDAAGTRPIDPAPRPYLHLDETISPVVLTDFDVEAYTRKDHGRLPVETELLHAQDPLPAAMVRALRAWQHLEATALTERSEEHTSELQSRVNLVCLLLLDKNIIML